MAGGGGIKLAGGFQVLRHQRRRAGLVELAQLELRHRMIGGGGGLQQRQGAPQIGRPDFALQIHVGQVGLGGGQAGFGGAQINLFGLFGVLGGALALAQHHAEVAHGGEILVAQVPPDLEGLFVIARVIGGDAGIEHRGDLGAGARLGRACQTDAGRQENGKMRKNLVYLGHAPRKATLPKPETARTRAMTMETGGPLDDGGIAAAADPFALFRGLDEGGRRLRAQ